MYGTVTTTCLQVLQFIRNLTGIILLYPFQEPKGATLMKKL